MNTNLKFIKKSIFLIAIFAISNYSNAADLTKYVNPFIGTDAHGHTYPGASSPFGMVQLSADTRLTGWDGCSAYHYSDSVLYGFSHTHLSGTGCSDYGDILLIPVIGNVGSRNFEYASKFSHKNEIAAPGYYSVVLDKYNIKAELTATARVGMHRYTFPANESPKILLDLFHRDSVLETRLEIIDSVTVTGVRRSTAWAGNQIVYFAVKFSRPFANHVEVMYDTIFKTTEVCGSKNLKAFFLFDNAQNNQIILKVGLSAVSSEGALNNINAEVPGWDFDKVRENVKNEWNKELSKIEVEGDKESDLVKFYTALYHVMLTPNIYSDADGQYLGRDFKTHKAKDFDYYTVFSLWDTYRAFHPLLTIIDQKRTNDFINTFIQQFNQNGLLPVWELSSNETFCMIGYHSVSVIADAFIKGIRNYDVSNAFTAVIASANSIYFGLPYYRENNYLAGDAEQESVSKTLEYAYDDWCIAELAKSLKKEADYADFITRAQSWKNIFDKDTKFFRARFNGGWVSPFEPTEVNNNYTEANAWQYNFYAPQDISGLIGYYGSKKNFEEKLDELFLTKNKLSGRDQSDITGLIGQYAHGNEPSHHIAYLYNYVNKPNKTQKLVRTIIKDLYTDKPDGLCGNEDCGQMSAWLVMSAMGIYQVCPGKPDYAIGSPLFRKIKINLENGKSFIIRAENNSDENIYIESAELNNSDYSKSYITHADIMNGGELVLKMTNKQGSDFGTGKRDAPITSIDDYNIITSPVLMAPARTFTKNIKIGIESTTNDVNIYYTTNNTQPDSTSAKYTEPFEIKGTTTIKAISYLDGKRSKVTTGKYYQVPEGRSIKLYSTYNKQYTAGGPEGLIDNLRGFTNFRLGGWQGYQGQDFEAVVDLGKVQKINRLAAGFLQETRAWILMPKSVEFYVSSDSTTWDKVAIINNDIPAKNLETITKDFSYSLSSSARWIKVKAYNSGKLPDWHPGAGGESFIFIDEIIVE